MKAGWILLANLFPAFVASDNADLVQSGLRSVPAPVNDKEHHHHSHHHSGDEAVGKTSKKNDDGWIALAAQTAKMQLGMDTIDANTSAACAACVSAEAALNTHEEALSTAQQELITAESASAAAATAHATCVVEETTATNTAATAKAAVQTKMTSVQSEIDGDAASSANGMLPDLGVRMAAWVSAKDALTTKTNECATAQATANTNAALVPTMQAAIVTAQQNVQQGKYAACEACIAMRQSGFMNGTASTGDVDGGCTLNVDCVGSWSACTAACETGAQRTFTTTTPQSGQGAACPAAVNCQPGEGACPLNVNCAGSWSACTAACEAAGQRTFTTTTPQSGQGAACPTASNCQPGDGACPLNVDCVGSWSACTAACETAAQRTFTTTTPQSGNGVACPTTSDCQPGEGACPQTGWTPPSGFNPSCQAPDSEGYHYIFDYRDVRGTDDLPNEASGVAAGFTNANAFYIGNAQLEQLDLNTVTSLEACIASTSSNCNEACETIDTSSYADGGSNCNFPDLTDNRKKVIAGLSGQCVGGGTFMNCHEVGCPQFQGVSARWMVVSSSYDHFRGAASVSGTSGGFHGWGYGPTMFINGGMNHGGDLGGDVEFAWYSHSDHGSMDIDTIRVRYKTA